MVDDEVVVFSRGLMKQGGFFELATPQHLLEKAIHDINRLRANHIDSYAAFDFFIAARHIPNWLYPDDSEKCENLFIQFVELRICRHLADGSKHFVVSQSRHKQVKETVRSHFDPWGGSWGGSWGKSWGRYELIVRLDQNDPDTSKFGGEIKVLELAERVLRVLEQVVLKS